MGPFLCKEVAGIELRKELRTGKETRKELMGSAWKLISIYNIIMAASIN